MSRLLRNGDSAMFWCPGCNHIHMISDSWQITGTDDAPTIGPSVLVYSHGKFIDDSLDGEALFDSSNRTSTPRCHSFVTDGMIAFLGDSTHELVGQTVPLPELPEWLEEA